MGASTATLLLPQGSGGTRPETIDLTLPASDICPVYPQIGDGKTPNLREPRKILHNAPGFRPAQERRLGANRIAPPTNAPRLRNDRPRRPPRARLRLSQRPRE